MGLDFLYVTRTSHKSDFFAGMRSGLREFDCISHDITISFVNNVNKTDNLS